jgi:hypothetical protein
MRAAPLPGASYKALRKFEILRTITMRMLRDEIAKLRARALRPAPALALALH